MRNTIGFIFILLVLLGMTACSDNEGDEFTFVVSMGENGKTFCNGLDIEFGSTDGNEAIAKTSVDKEGKACFNLNPEDYINKEIWICIPKVVKFFHVLAPEECNSGILVLPDKDKGSTLLPSPTIDGKCCINDWIVALYMGVAKDGKLDVPIYWATGNIIATKTTQTNEATKALFHISTLDELILQTKVGNYVGDDNRIIFRCDDSYLAFPLGTQWDRFHYGDTTGTSLYTAPDILEYIVAKKQTGVFDIAGNADYDIANAQFGGSWSIPTGGLDEKSEWAAFEDNNDEFMNLEPNATDWITDGTKIGYKYEYIVKVNGCVITANTLYLPFTGFRHGTKEIARGISGWYWAGTADRQGLTPYLPAGQTLPADFPQNENTNAYTFGMHDGLKEKIVHPRTSVEAIRPITE